MTSQLPSLTPAVSIRSLRLRGADRDYTLDLTDAQGSTSGLHIVAGPSQTGKTTVLRFIDFGLGARRHPSHPEIRRRVRSASLELALGASLVQVERPANDESSNVAWVKLTGARGTDEQLPERRLIAPPGDPASLSSRLLAACDLEGIELRVAPTKADSATQGLSFRDVMPLCYLDDERMGTRRLLYDGDFMRRNKLEQVVDIIFDVRDSSASDAGARVRSLEERRRSLLSDIGSLEAFAEEQRISAPLTLDGDEARAASDLNRSQSALTILEQGVRQATEFAQELHRRHGAAVAATRVARARIRDRRTQLTRLESLEAQYSADLSRLEFFAEVGVLFNDLHVERCPACMQALPSTPTIAGGACSLCQQTVPGLSSLALGESAGSSDTSPAPEASFDPRAEIDATKRRRNELSRYQAELLSGLVELEGQLARAQQVESEAASELDERTREALSPSLRDRDALMRQISVAQGVLDRIQRDRRVWDSIEKRRVNLGRVESTLKGLRKELRDQRAERTSRAQLVVDISARFGQILEDFEFPRLSNPHLDERLQPFVRDIDYRDQSDGAKTLISLAWTLAIMELSWERGGKHPGFLLLDSPQRGFGRADVSDPEFRDARLVNAFYEHVLSWLDGHGAGAQVIVADNAAPQLVEDHVVVRFSGDPSRPPYGLIDDETE